MPFPIHVCWHFQCLTISPPGIQVARDPDEVVQAQAGEQEGGVEFETEVAPTPATHVDSARVSAIPV